MGSLRLCPFRYDTARDDLFFRAIALAFPLLEYCLYHKTLAVQATQKRRSFQ
jgi:hypothetical protein